MKSISVIFLILGSYVTITCAWNNDELEIFDLVEEVNQNFYELLEISQDAGANEIKKAFRKLSLVLHPDKNPSPDADVKFRQLVAVYEVIKDPSKRQRYDDVLVNGLPDWRSAVYYYRRVRKMGLTELSIILFIIVSVGQYLVGWGSYLEKRFVVEEFVSSKLRKQQKKGLKKAKGDNSPMVETVLSKIPTPSVKDTLPFQIPRFIWWSITEFPRLFQEYLEEQKRQREEQRILKEKERAAMEAASFAALEKAERGPRKRKGGGFVAPEITEDGTAQPTQAQILAQAKRAMAAEIQKPARSGGLWTDEDIAELIKLTKKYPTGTLERWEKIADAMERSVSEVTHMAQKVKEEGYRAPVTDKREEECPALEDLALMGKSKKVKTRGGKLGVGEASPTQAEDIYNAEGDTTWNQVQQKALEIALVKYPKGTTQDRWDKISKCVPGKTKEECLLRFKFLVDMVKKKQEKDVAEGARNVDEISVDSINEEASTPVCSQLESAES